ncbi:MAG: hypothetical protein HY042_06755, partial [Spirochaetia bacterium]|nr:hypothetical protein [Spirochaetia bacterium]
MTRAPGAPAVWTVSGWRDLALFCLCVFLAAPLHAEKSAEPSPAPEKRDTETPAPAKEQVFLEWTAVDNARGYIVEIKNEKGDITRQESEGTRVNLKLAPGRYTQRVGALNIFKKPASWSEWKELLVMKPVAPKVALVEMPESEQDPSGKTRSVRIQGENFFEDTKVSLLRNGEEIPVEKQRTGDSTLGMVLVLDRDKLQPGKNQIKIENPGGKVQIAEIEMPGGTKDGSAEDEAPEFKGPPRYLALLPGIYQWQDGRRLESSLWLTAFVGSLVGFASEHQAAQRSARDAQGNVTGFYFSNAVLFAPAQNKSDLLSVGFYNDIESQKSRNAFRIHDRNRKYYGATAASILLFNVHTALPYKAEYVLPGLTEFKTGQTWLGSAMMTTTALLAGGLVASYARAEHLSTNASNDPTYKVLNDTGTLYVVLNNTSVSRETYLYWYAKAAERTAQRSRYDQYQQAQAVSAVSLAG